MLQNAKKHYKSKIDDEAHNSADDGLNHAFSSLS